MIEFQMRKLLLLTTFFLASPIFVVFSALYFMFLTYQKTPMHFLYSASSQRQKVAYAAVSTTQSIIPQEIIHLDARVEIVRQFFAKYNSPLEPFAKQIVNAADAYGLDYRLVPSIAMQESNLCQKIPKDSYNCWGFGIYDKKIKRFNNYPEAIDMVTKTLSSHYKDKLGLQTPSEIMTVYTPSNNGAWAYAVSHFMDQLQ